MLRDFNITIRSIKTRPVTARRSRACWSAISSKRRRLQKQDRSNGEAPHGASPFCNLWLAGPEEGEAGEQQIRAKGLAQQVYVQGRGQPGSRRRGQHGGGNGTLQGGLVQIAAPEVAAQGAGGGGEEEQQIDALSGPLVHAQKQRHHQQQQRPAAHAPGGNDPGPQTAQKGDPILRHSRYFTPA